MDKELLQPAAIITVELLRNAKTSDGNLSEDVIASAFEQAYLGLALGIERVERESRLRRQPPAPAQPLKL